MTDAEAEFGRRLFVTSLSSPQAAVIMSDSDMKKSKSADADGKVGELDDVTEGIAGMSLDMDFIKGQEEIYDRCCMSHPVSVGKALSSRERDEKGLNSSTLVYGEISFESYAIAFEKIKNKYGGLQKPGGKFYDIGSGTGKPALAAALLHDWDHVVGIEILEGLHSASIELLEKWNTEIKPDLPAAKQKTEVEFLNDDVTKRDWSDGDMFFANSTCFDEVLMSKLATIADKMKVGTFCVTFTKRLPSAKWQVLEHQVYKMSWGNATVYIQKKIHL
mmetsp:Transcript_74948/g.207497  ORF Transcript_74948/g.207497 Transcript_74948/m.207497 type:complete len:275 (-) Transcript_74948:278-1102(-)